MEDIKNLTKQLFNKCKDENCICAGIFVNELDEDSEIIVPIHGKSIDVLAAICTLIERYIDASGRKRTDVLLDIINVLSEEE